MKSLLYKKELFVTKPLSNWKEFTFPQEELQEVPPTSCDHKYLSQSDQVAHLIQQSQLYDLVRDLNLSKQRTELTESRLL
jgi:hypothetical protein